MEDADIPAGTNGRARTRSISAGSFECFLRPDSLRSSSRRASSKRSWSLIPCPAPSVTASRKAIHRVVASVGTPALRGTSQQGEVVSLQSGPEPDGSEKRDRAADRSTWRQEIVG